MNKEEYLEMHAEMVNNVLAYERFCKDAFLTDLRYNATFGDLLIQLNYYQRERDLIKLVLSLINQKTDGDGYNLDDEVAKLLSDAQSHYDKELEIINRKHKHSVELDKKLKEMSQEDSQELEQLFVNYVQIYHPAVKVYVTKQEQIIYNELKIAYYECDLHAFKKYMEMHKDDFTDPKMTEEFVAAQNQSYYNTKNQISKDVAARMDKYPFDKKPVFEDEITIAAEIGELRSKVKKMSEQSKLAHQEMKQYFPSDIILISRL